MIPKHKLFSKQVYTLVSYKDVHVLSLFETNYSRQEPTCLVRRTGFCIIQAHVKNLIPGKVFGYHRLLVCDFTRELVWDEISEQRFAALLMRRLLPELSGAEKDISRLIIRSSLLSS